MEAEEKLREEADKLREESCSFLEGLRSQGKDGPLSDLSDYKPPD